MLTGIVALLLLCSCLVCMDVKCTKQCNKELFCNPRLCSNMLLNKYTSTFLVRCSVPRCQWILIINYAKNTPHIKSQHHILYYVQYFMLPEDLSKGYTAELDA